MENVSPDIGATTLIVVAFIPWYKQRCWLRSDEWAPGIHRIYVPWWAIFLDKIHQHVFGKVTLGPDIRR